MLSRRCALVLAGTVAVSAPSPGAQAADPASAPAGAAAAAASDPNSEARVLFSQGQIHYSLGEYDLAVAAFRRAYELSSAPGLLFNIAQAHRLNGECKPAMEAYRHYLRLVPTSAYRAEAEKQIAALVVRCGGGAAEPAPARAAAPATANLKLPEAARPAPPSEPAASLVSQARPPEMERSPWSTRRKTSAALLAGGVGLGMVAGGIYWWNNGRYDDWRTKDQQLQNPPAGTAPDVWLAQQQSNDALLRSVQRMDTIDLTLAGVAIAAVIASAVLLVISDR